MARSSTIPAAIPALVAAFRASPALEGAAIYDGPVVTASGTMGSVVVGWTGTEGDELAVEVANAAADLADASGKEDYSIRCAASARTGTGDPVAAITAARNGVYGLLDACAAALAANRTLGGAVMHARIGTHSLDQIVDTGGVTALVEFLVDVQAFTGR